MSADTLTMPRAPLDDYHCVWYYSEVFKVEYTPSAVEDLQWLEKVEQRLIVGAIKEQLHWEPLTETRKRKQLRPNDLSQWELRTGKYRVFYDVSAETQSVKIKAVGWKEHTKLFIRGREFQL